MVKFYSAHAEKLIYQTKYNFSIYVLPEKLWDIIKWDKSCDAEPIMDYMVSEEVTGNVFVDIGANIGIVSTFAANRFKEVYSFEPVIDNLKYFRNNIKLNGVTNVSIFDYCVSDTNGNVELFIREQFGHHGLTSAHESATNDILMVKSVTLDTFMAEKKIVSIDVLKIDVEGAERLVFEGARQALTQGSIEMIIFEYQPNQLSHVDLKFIVNTLTSAGYDLFNTDNIPVDLDLIVSEGYGDYIAKHKQTC